MIILKNVSKTYGKVAVLSHVSFEVNPGEFLCITGPSGAGKSTLLSILVGADTCSKGTVEVDGVDLRKVPVGALQLFRRRVGVVFQDFKLLQNRTVAENISYPLEVCGVTDAQVKSRCTELLRRMELETKGDMIPSSLSGGEKARTAIARAIVHKPIILLADEPTGNLDPAQSERIFELLKQINEEGTTIILATHDTALVDRLHTRVIGLDQGKVVRDSVGGYSAGRAASTAVKHDVFGKDAASLSASAPSKTAEGTDVSADDKAPGQKKIRITSINS